MSERNQLDLNCIADLVAVISQLNSYINSTLIDFLCHLNTPFYNFYRVV